MSFDVNVAFGGLYFDGYLCLKLTRISILRLMNRYDIKIILSWSNGDFECI